MTARKAPAKKAAARKAPAKRPAKAAPRPAAPETGPPSTPARELTVEERLAVLEQKMAQIEPEHVAMRQVIEQAILAQMQQQLATNPNASGILQALIQQQNGQTS